MSVGHPYTVEPAPPRKQSSNTVWIIVGVAVLLLMMLMCGGVLLGLLLPAVSAAREAARRMESSNNMKMIGLALHNYHDVHRSFPPAYTTNEAGEPLLSWRVHILPFLDQAPLYDQFHLDEPWDSPHNRALLERIPEVYRSPRFDETAGPYETNYVAIRDPQSLFPGADSVRFSDIADGTSATLAAIEMEQTGIPWSSPDDVTPEEAYDAIASGRGKNVLIGDGSVRFMNDELNPTAFNAMVTRDGQDQVAW